MYEANTDRITQVAALTVAMLVALSMATGAAVAAGTTSISVSAADQTLEPGATTTVSVVLDDAAGGVGSAQLAVALTDPSVAEITDVELGTSPGNTDGPVFAADNSSVQGGYAFDDTADSGAVTVAVVTVEATAAGSTGVEVTAPPDVADGTLAFFDEGGAGYTLDTVGSATLTVEAANSPPTASVSGPSTAQVGEDVTFQASASDPDGSIDSYAWDFDGDGTADATGQSPTVTTTFDSAGEVTVELTVTDDDGATATATTTLTVEATNSPPTASISGPSTAQVGEVVTFQASASDPDGSIVSYAWDFDGDGTVDVTSPTPSVDTSFASAGEETVELTVTDDGGATATATQTVSVTEAPDPASFQVSNLTAPSTATQGEPIEVTATVENTGTEEGTQTVEFEFDGSVLADQSVTLAGGASEEVSFDVDTTGVAAGTYTHGVATDDDSATAQITIEEPSTPGDGDLSTTVELVGDDANGQIAAGDTVTYDVVVTDAFGGVGAYSLSVDVSNGTVASVDSGVATDASGEGLTDTTITDSSATIEAALLDTNDTGSVSIASVTVVGVGPGTTDVTLNVTALGNESGQSYTVESTTDASLEVLELPPVDPGDDDGPDPAVPTDPDDDGVFEDINGDGQFTVADVQLLFAERNSNTVTEYGTYYDINGDGTFDIVDVQALWTELNAED